MSVVLDGVLASAAPNMVATLSGESVATLLYALSRVSAPWQWLDYQEDPADEITVADWDTIERLLGEAAYQLMNPFKPIPAGAIMMHGASTPPDGWLLCDGSEVSRSTYALLFDAIGETWGDGDGTTTFNLPDFNYRSPMGPGESDDQLNSISIASKYGENRHTLITQELPAHTHGITDPGHNHTITDPGHTHSSVVSAVNPASNRALVSSGGVQLVNPSTNTGNNTTGISVQNASTGVSANSTGSDIAHNNVHPITGVPFIIFTGLDA